MLRASDRLVRGMNTLLRTSHSGFAASTAAAAAGAFTGSGSGGSSTAARSVRLSGRRPYRTLPPKTSFSMRPLECGKSPAARPSRAPRATTLLEKRSFRPHWSSVRVLQGCMSPPSRRIIRNVMGLQGGGNSPKFVGHDGTFWLSQKKFSSSAASDGTASNTPSCTFAVPPGYPRVCFHLKRRLRFRCSLRTSFLSAGTWS